MGADHRAGLLWAQLGLADPRQTLEDIIAGLAAAWAFCGGIPRLPGDRQLSARGGGTRPAAPALHQGLPGILAAPRFHRRRRSRQAPQGQAQSGAGRAVREGALLQGPRFQRLGHVRSEARRVVHQGGWPAGPRHHAAAALGGSFSWLVFQEEERHTLLPWDGEPYDIADWRNATVHPDHHIQCQQALYSVPWDRCPPGRKVEIRLGSQLARIYHRGELIKTHVRQPKGGRSTDPDDYPAELSPYTHQVAAPHQAQRGQAGTRGGRVRRAPLRRPPALGQDPAGPPAAAFGKALHAPASRHRLPPKPWTWTSSTCAGWNASWCRRWKKKPRPNCRCLSRPVASPVPVASSPIPTDTPVSRQ